MLFRSLEKAGWIEGEFRTLARGGAPVRYYTLTPDGRHTLTQKRQGYSAFSRHIRTLLGGDS